VTRLRLPLLGGADEPPETLLPSFEPLAPHALLSPPCPMILVAGARAARSRAVPELLRALRDAGLRATRFDEPPAIAERAELTRAINALAAQSDVIVVDGNATLGLYRATLSLLLGSAELHTERALRPLLGRADIELDEAPPALLASLATLVVRATRRT